MKPRQLRANTDLKLAQNHLNVKDM